MDGWMDDGWIRVNSQERWASSFLAAARIGFRRFRPTVDGFMLVPMWRRRSFQVLQHLQKLWKKNVAPGLLPISDFNLEIDLQSYGLAIQTLQ